MDEIWFQKPIRSRYVIEREIGRGFYSAVYLATDRRLSRRVAVKALKPGYAGDQEIVRRFLDMARATARVSHPHVVDVFEMGRAEGTYYMVMRHVPGPSLGDARREFPPQSAIDFLQWLSAVVDALATAHEAHVAHGHLSPRNILLAHGRIPVLTDFGLLGTRRSEFKLALTTPDALRFVAPEQRDEGVVDHRSDQYAVVALLLELLAERLPDASFVRRTPLNAVTPDSRLFPQLPRSIGEQLEALLHLCISVDPEERFPSLRDLHEELQALKVQLGEGLHELEEEAVRGGSPREERQRGGDPLRGRLEGIEPVSPGVVDHAEERSRRRAAGSSTTLPPLRPSPPRRKTPPTPPLAPVKTGGGALVEEPTVLMPAVQARKRPPEQEYEPDASFFRLSTPLEDERDAPTTPASPPSPPPPAAPERPKLIAEIQVVPPLSLLCSLDEPAKASVPERMTSDIAATIILPSLQEKDPSPRPPAPLGRVIEEEDIIRAGLRKTPEEDPTEQSEEPPSRRHWPRWLRRGD
jgi:serine/threonine-protein kinase